MRKILLMLMTALAVASCRQNPFFLEWDTPYGIPPFEEIRIGDYLPAIQKGIEEQDAAVKAIAENPADPTFENTIVALEESGRLLAKVEGVLLNLCESDNSPELDSLMAQVLPLLSEHADNISFNKTLYHRIALLYRQGQEPLTREQQMVLKRHFEDFEREGVGLCARDQRDLKALNAELSTKIQQIGNNILAENNAFRERFGISVSEYSDAMTTTEDRALREQMFHAYSMRGHNGGEHDNTQLVIDVMRLRIRKAHILGYDCPASYILENKMAHDPRTVDEFLAGIMPAAVAQAGREKAEIDRLAGFRTEPWDWWYYAEKVRKEKYDLDDEQIRPYFRYENVLRGAFLAAKRLYGIEMEEIPGVPVYNPAATTYKVTDADGSLLGIFITDPSPRTSKRGGAWMSNFREQYVDADGNEIRPIIVNVCNLQETLTVDDVQTVFHEFGHALHGLLTRCHYASVSGTNVTRDFVEMFSQFNENWAFQPDLLAEYAYNDKGELIPAELVEKINRAMTFNQGFMTTELCAASILDMRWHELSGLPEEIPDAGAWIDAFEADCCREAGLPDAIIPRYRTTYFNHIFGSGYNAGYYGYLWAEVLDKDAFSAFVASPDGPWDMALATRFRRTFLEKGGAEEPMTLYTSFMGREPLPDAMLRARGLRNF